MLNWWHEILLVINRFCRGTNNEFALDIKNMQTTKTEICSIVDKTCDEVATTKMRYV